MADSAHPGSRREAPYTDADRRARRLRTWGWLTLAAGILMGSAHLIAHRGRLEFLSTTGWEDVVLGYPMAAAVSFAGFAMIRARTA